MNIIYKHTSHATGLIVCCHLESNFLYKGVEKASALRVQVIWSGKYALGGQVISMAWEICTGRSGNMAWEICHGRLSNMAWDICPGRSGNMAWEICHERSGNMAWDICPGRSGDMAWDICPERLGDMAWEICPGRSYGYPYHPWTMHLLWVRMSHGQVDESHEV